FTFLIHPISWNIGIVSLQWTCWLLWKVFAKLSSCTQPCTLLFPFFNCVLVCCYDLLSLFISTVLLLLSPLFICLSPLLFSFLLPFVLFTCSLCLYELRICQVPSKSSRKKDSMI
ncbi:hypothetical protein BDQ17DRAFT_1473577, partial [Cyathus striatus]